MLHAATADTQHAQNAPPQGTRKLVAPAARQLHPRTSAAGAVRGATALGNQAMLRGLGLSAAKGQVQRCACGGVVGADGECASCKAQRLARASSPGAARTPAVAPPIVHDVLRGSGSRLDPATRAFMETRFGADFARVQVHTGEQAAQSAAAVDAVAYTVGNHVVFGAGAYAPHSSSGRALLAHELAHVVQQGDANTGTALEVAPARSPAEQQAQQAAQQVVSGSGVAGSLGNVGAAASVQRLACADLVDAQEMHRVNGTQVHSAIREDFVSQLGKDAFPIKSIPFASFRAYALSCGDGGARSRVDPQILGGNAGRGDVDLAARGTGNDVLLAEIKPAHPSCLDEGRLQIAHYRTQGNRYPTVRRDGGIDTYRLMPMSRYTPDSPIIVGREPVSVAWCEDGLMVYKAVRDQDPAVFVCTTSDQGRIDAFLDTGMERAQSAIDRHITKVIEPKLDKLVDKMTLREAILALNAYAAPLLADFLVIAMGLKPAEAKLIVSAMPSKAVVEMAARLIEQQLQDHAVTIVRQIAHTIKRRVLVQLRQIVQNNLRTLLQQALNVACAAALAKAAITIDDVIDELVRKIPRHLGDALDAALLAMAAELVAIVSEALAQAMTILEEIGKAILVELLGIAAAVVAVVTIAAALDPVPGDELIPAAVLAGIRQMMVNLTATSAVPVGGAVLAQ